MLFSFSLYHFFIWASNAELEEVTRGNGKIIASSKLQVIQNLEGGIINDIAVRTGDRVNEGDLLVKLDETKFLGDLNSANNNLNHLINLSIFIRRRKINFRAACR